METVRMKVLDGYLKHANYTIHPYRQGLLRSTPKLDRIDTDSQNRETHKKEDSISIECAGERGKSIFNTYSAILCPSGIMADDFGLFDYGRLFQSMRCAKACFATTLLRVS